MSPDPDSIVGALALALFTGYMGWSLYRLLSTGSGAMGDSGWMHGTRLVRREDDPLMYWTLVVAHGIIVLGGMCSVVGVLA